MPRAGSRPRGDVLGVSEEAPGGPSFRASGGRGAGSRGRCHRIARSARALPVDDCSPHHHEDAWQNQQRPPASDEQGATVRAIPASTITRREAGALHRLIRLWLRRRFASSHPPARVTVMVGALARIAGNPGPVFAGAGERRPDDTGWAARPPVGPTRSGYGTVVPRRVAIPRRTGS